MAKSMTLSEAIDHAEFTAQSLYKDLEYKCQEQGLKETDKAYTACKSCADEHWQLADWLRELRRLQGLAAHTDTYEQGGYAFYYHEMGGMCSISAMRTAPNGEWKPLGHYELDGPHSHEFFVAWCKNWLEPCEEAQDHE